MPQISFRIEERPARVVARLAEGESELPALWLRERSQDAAHLDDMTRQRLFNPHDLYPGLHLVEARQTSPGHAWLGFSDGYAGLFDLSEFLADFDTEDGVPAMQAWTASIDVHEVRFDWARLGTDAQLLPALEAFLRRGMLIIQGVPCERDSILEVGRRFGHVRETNFGRYFEVYSRPQSDDLAYRAVGLAPHTDNPYRNPVPGIQLLHCLVNETSGGLSTLVDSLSAVQRLREEDPDGFRLLTEVPVRYRYVSADIELIERRPLIETDHQGQVTGVHYSPRLDYMPLLNAEDTRRFQRARQRLGQLFSDPGLELRFLLKPGELMLFDNSRVLHGRTGYDPQEGHRHLQGCYIDMDAPRGRYRALKRAALEPLAATGSAA